MIPKEVKEFINEITSKALVNGKFSVNVSFSGADVSVHFFPISNNNELSNEEPEKVEVYND